MFKNLLDFGYQRSGKEAVGFYLAYLLFIALFSGLSSMATSIVQPSPGSFGEGFAEGVRIGAAIAIVLALVLAFLVLKEKKLIAQPAPILFLFLAGLLAIFLGALGGLLPVAYLTTLPKAGQREEQQHGEI